MFDSKNYSSVSKNSRKEPEEKELTEPCVESTKQISLQTKVPGMDSWKWN